MTIARRETVVEGEVGTYHIISRCVRRAFLCGDDRGRNFDHRRLWIQERLQSLSSIFAVEIIAYSVMSNHLHSVVRVRPDWVETWPDEVVAERWLHLYPKRRQDDDSPATPNAAEIRAIVYDPEKLAACRERLASLSWFCRGLNEYIARKANAEDDCTGHFWEGRYKCQRLLDDAAVLACMAYVDLNPIRAKAAETPETSDFTSAQDRIASRQARRKLKALKAQEVEPLNERQTQAKRREVVRSRRADWLMRLNQEATPPITLDEYLELLDWTGRQIREGKRGAIPAHLSPILIRLQIDTARWVETVLSFRHLFHRVAGKVDKIVEAAKRAGRRWLKGLAASQTAFPLMT